MAFPRCEAESSLFPVTVPAVPSWGGDGEEGEQPVWGGDGEEGGQEGLEVFLKQTRSLGRTECGSQTQLLRSDT